MARVADPYLILSSPIVAAGVSARFDYEVPVSNHEARPRCGDPHAKNPYP